MSIMLKADSLSVAAAHNTILSIAHLAGYCTPVKKGKRPSRAIHRMHIAMYVARRAGFGVQEIGSAMKRTYSLVSYASKKVDNWIRIYPEVRHDVHSVMASVEKEMDVEWREL